MDKNIFAYTDLNETYPGFVSINQTPQGDISVTVRTPPLIRDGVYICGFKREKGMPGRCTPGDERCNNYCNMAPEKGKMQDRPAPCKQIIEGKTSSFLVPAEKWSLGDVA